MSLLQEIENLWTAQIKVCSDHKELVFGKSARQIWRYMGQTYRDAMFELDGLGLAMPRQRADRERPAVPKVAEFVRMFCTYIHERVPHRRCSPRIEALSRELAEVVGQLGGEAALQKKRARGRDDQIMAWLAERFANWTIGEYDLFGEAKLAVQESLAKGCGLLWQEVESGPFGPIPVSSFDSVDNWLVDSDVKQLRDAGFVIRLRCRPVWQVHREYGVPLEKIRGVRKSGYAQAWWQAHLSEALVGGNPGGVDAKHDLCVYAEVWSRMGVGRYLNGAPQTWKNAVEAIDALGDHVFLAILPGLGYPMNLPPLGLGDTAEEHRRRLQWPLAVQEEMSNPFPCEPLIFHPSSEHPYGTPPLEAAMVQQVVIDEIYWFLIHRAAMSNRDLIVAAESLAADVKKALESGNDQEVVTVPTDQIDIDHLVKVLVRPELKQELFRILDALEKKFEQSSGLAALLYGGTGETQARSAYEIKVRQGNLTARHEDYAEVVTNWMGRVGSKELLIARQYVSPRTVAPLWGEEAFFQEAIRMAEEEAAAGEGEQAGRVLDDLDKDVLVQRLIDTRPEVVRAEAPLTYLWSVLVNTTDPAVAAAEVRVTCEAGEGTRRNRDEQLATFQTILQNGGPLAQQMALQGVPGPWNKLWEYFSHLSGEPLERLPIIGPEEIDAMMAGQRAQQDAEREDQEADRQDRADERQAKREGEAQKLASTERQAAIKAALDERLAVLKAESAERVAKSRGTPRANKK